MNKDEGYKTYFEMQKLVIASRESRSEARKNKNHDEADYLGEKIATIQKCMSIVVKNMDLYFE